jgi:hypothetical protein
LENLKTLRLLHQVLMLVAAAILAFAVHSDQSDDYNAAVGELLTIQELRVDGWGSFIEDRFKKEAAQNDYVARELIHKLDLTAPPGKTVLKQPFLGETPPDIRTARLADLKAFLTATHRIGILDLRSLDLSKAVSQLLPEPHLGTGQFLTGISIHVPGQPASERGAVELFVLDNQSTSTPTTINVDIWQRFGNPTSTGMCGVVVDDGKPEDWLRHDPNGRKLFDPSTGEPFPHLRPFWDSVRAQNTGQAVSFLKEQLAANARGTLSFFGIPVELSLVVSAGPIVCFAILFFFLVHLRHFRTFAEGEADIRTFPWVPLFRGFLPMAVTYVTVLLPILSNAALLYRFGHRDDLWSRVGAAATMLTLFTAVFVLREIHRLRK